MAHSDGRTEPNEGSGAAEPITLNDPDGSVTRVAPWSTWTREQVRAPGGEPALVTHLEAGQLWFAAGRPRSPWRHEIRVGPAVVSTPRGRFHVTAEPDGGATNVCLAGRTRIVAGLREPVLLGPDQTAAVSSDGATLVVMDRSVEDDALGELDAVETATPTLTLVDDATPAPAEEPQVADPAPVVAPRVPVSAIPDDALPDSEPEPFVQEPIVATVAPPNRGRRILAEIVAVAALVTVLIAAAIVVSRGGSDSDTADVAAGPATTAEQADTKTTEMANAPQTTAAPKTTAPATTAATKTTSAPATTIAIVSNPNARAAGTLVGCRRGDNAVIAEVAVRQSSGGAAAFKATVALYDGDTKFAEGSAQTSVLDNGASATVEVSIPTPGGARGACEFVGVAAV